MEKQHKRVFEIDLVRGFILILVVAYHLVYDLYEFLQLESLSFIRSLELDLFLRLPFLGVLILISGISCSFRVTICGAVVVCCCILQLLRQLHICLSTGSGRAME